MKQMQMKYCKVCDNGFFCRRQSAKFCSPACRQLDYRRRHGQTVVRSEVARKTVEGLSSREKCPNCGAYFWTNTTGRKRIFCSDSCRVSANRSKRAAAYKALMATQGLGQYDAFMLLQQNGIAWVDEMLLRFHQMQYNFASRRYEGASLSLGLSYA